MIGLTANATTTTENDSDHLVNAGLVPGDFFYSTDRFFERVSLSLTINDKKKIEKYLRYAEERLAELNEIDPEKKHEWVDKLFDDYGVNLQKANNILTNLIAEEKISQTKIKKLQIKVEAITTKEEMIHSKTKAKINNEAKSAVQELKVQSYLLALYEDLSEDEISILLEKKIMRQDIVKIKALSLLSGLSIIEIIELDIFLPDNPKSKKMEVEFDFNKLEAVLGINKEQLVVDLKAYHKSLNENRKAEHEKENAEKEIGKSQEEINRLKDEAKKREEEAEKKRKEIEEKIKERMNENNNNQGNGKGS